MSKRKRLKPLPALAFGGHRASVDLTPQAMQDRVQGMTNWVTRQDALAHDGDFEYQSSVAQLGDLKLIASASTPTTMQVDGPGASVVIPIHGHFTTRMGGTLFEYQAGEAAFLMPKGFRDSAGGVKSSLIIGFEESRLHQTIAAMSGGGEATALTLSLEDPMLLKLRAGNVEFDRVFLGLCQMIDKFHGHDAALEAMGISDSFYRGLAILLNQQHFLKPATEQPGTRLEKVCAYIEDHLSEPIILTDLERISNLSARALQYAFMKRYDCTPMQYVRRRKAHYARELLLHPTENTTIAAVALQCGFANFSKFSAFYASIFNERPSDTLKNALK